MMRRTILVRVLAATLEAAAITTLMAVGINPAGAQTNVPMVVNVVQVCPRGSFACNDFTGRRLILTRSLGVTRTIPTGCGNVSPTGPATLPTNDAVIIHSGDAAVHLTVNPEYSNPSPGDRIETVQDQEQCCLNSSGDAVQQCMGTNGETTVRWITGALF